MALTTFVGHDRARLDLINAGLLALTKEYPES
jgi:hypothetical protein